MSAAGDFLRKSAQVIRDRGLYQGAFCPMPPFRDTDRDEWFATCPVCALGAMNVVITGHPLVTRVFEDPIPAARLALFTVINEGSAADRQLPIDEWSDASTEAEVIDAFERAAALADREAA